MSIKYIFALSLFLMSYADGFGQEINDDVIVYLNGDGYLKGKLAESSDPAYTKIVLYDSTAVKLLNASIEKIKRARKRKPLSNGIKNKGYYGSVSAGWLNARTEYGDFPEMEWGLGLHTVHGYQFNQYLGIGAGTGITFIPEYSFIPLFLNVRSYPFNSLFAPYVNLDIGYGFTTEEATDNVDKKGGIMVHPAVGLRFPSKHAAHFFIELGMRFQKAKRITNWWQEEVSNITFRRTSLVFGVAF